jgi:hypothetical protein
MRLQQRHGVEFGRWLERFLALLHDLTRSM